MSSVWGLQLFYVDSHLPLDIQTPAENVFGLPKYS